MKMSKYITSVLLLVSLFTCGCDCDRGYHVSPSALRLEPFSLDVSESSSTNSLSQSNISNAIVAAVNNHVLTKTTFKKLMSIYLKGKLEQKDMSPLVANKLLEEHERRYPYQFIRQRLLVDYGFREGIVTTNEVLDAVSDLVCAAAKRKKQRVEQYLGGFADDAHYFLYEQCVDYVMRKVINERIPPKAEVDEKFMMAVKKQVQAENAESRATNAVLKTELERLRSQVLSNAKTWATATAELEEKNLGEGGEWGEFTVDDFDNASHAVKIFALKEGACSETLEDDDGFRVVRVEKIRAREIDKDGNEMNPERRLLSSLYIHKRPLLIEESDVILTRDLKRQMQLQSVDEFVSVLATNGQNLVSISASTVFSE